MFLTSFRRATYKPGDYRRYDPHLGWTVASNGAAPRALFPDRRGIRVSESNRNSTVQAKYRIVAIGDSFTHGDEVRYEETWPYYLGLLTKSSVANLGVGHMASTERYYVTRARCWKGISCCWESFTDDLDRAMTQLYSYTMVGLQTKPVFDFKDEGVVILNQPAIHGNALRNEFSNPTSSDFLEREITLLPLITKSDGFYSTPTACIDLC